MNKNKLLVTVLAVLLAIYLGNKFIGGGNERNFKEVLVALDTAKVAKVVINAKTNKKVTVTFNKDGRQWQVTNDTITDTADKNSIEGILSYMTELKPQRLVATQEDKWAQYEVDDAMGTQVRLFDGSGEKLADIIIGKFSFNQAARTIATFVRLSGENEVYAVDGFISSAYDQSFDSFRDKTFLEITPANLTSVSFTYPGDSSFVLSKAGSSWQIDGVETDSAEVQTFINGLSKINQSEFADGFSSEAAPIYTMQLEGNNMPAIKVSAYAENDDMILHSSLNPDIYFKKGTLKIFDKLFVSPDKFSDE